MDRADVTAQVTAAKRREGLSWTDLGDRAGADRVWLTAALLGQHPVPPELARKLGDVLGLTEEAVAILQEIPTRGSFETLPPTDPTIYRLYEVLQVYGPALKALIHEDSGDGIMSAINFNLALERGESDAGPRVRITLDGKFLPVPMGAIERLAKQDASPACRCAGRGVLPSSNGTSELTPSHSPLIAAANARARETLDAGWPRPGCSRFKAGRR